MRPRELNNCINDNVSESTQAAPEEGERLEGSKVVEQSNRTTFEDNVGSTLITYGSDAATILRGKTDPYPSDDMSMILTREYRLPSISWLAANVRGDVLSTIGFPEALVDFPFISERLKNYMFFRSRVRITIRINTTKFEYGSLLISWLPYYASLQGQACRHLTLCQCSQNNGHILSANIGNTLTFDIPYISPLEYMKVADIDVGVHRGMLASVFISVLSPLLSVSPNPPTSVEISVFAKFVDPEVAGLQPLVVPPAILRREEKKAKKKIIDDVNNRRYIEAKPQSGKGRKVPTPANAKEADTKVNSGSLVDSAESAVSTVLSVVNTAMGVAGALEKLAPLLGALGLGKPVMNTPITKMMATQFPNIASSDGLDYPQQLTMKTGAQTAVDKMIIDGDDPSPLVYDMVRKPHLYHYYTFDNTAVPDDILYTTRVHPMNMNGQIQVSGTKYIMSMGPLNWFTSMYYFWRGSLKLLFYFNTSGFTTTRVRITHVPGVALSAADLGDYSGDLISKVVDITGDTTVEFTVPYLQQTLFSPVQFDYTGFAATDYNGTIMVSLVNPVNASDSTAASTVTCNVFIAAGEDFELMQFVGPRKPTGWTINTTKVLPTIDLEDSIEATAQMNIGSIFRKPFAGLTQGSYTLQKGMFTIDPPGSIVSLGHRYVMYTGSINAMYPLPTLTTGQHALGDSVLWYYAACHLFMRGSMRFLRMVNSAASTTNGGMYSIVNGSLSPPLVDGGWTAAVTPGSNFASALSPSHNVEIPYFGRVPFIESIATMTVDPTQYNYVTFAAIAPSCNMMAFGDDFSVGGLCAPPVYSFAVPLLDQRKRK